MSCTQEAESKGKRQRERHTVEWSAPEDCALVMPSIFKNLTSEHMKLLGNIPEPELSTGIHTTKRKHVSLTGISGVSEEKGNKEIQNKMLKK